MLYFLGLNLHKIFKFFETNKLDKYWIAPENLEPEVMKKPSWKRLSKKGKRINNKIMKNEE